MRCLRFSVAVVAIVLGVANAEAQAQTACLNNLDADGNVCTTFTIGAATANCIPVLTQDGQAVAQFSGAVCPSGFFGGGGMQIELPNDPSEPGNPLTMYSCSLNTISDVTSGATRVLTSALSCPVNYSYYSATWNGTLTYNYVQTRVRCGYKNSSWCTRLVYANGSGEVSTPQPPPAPPAPPSPTTVSLSLGAGPCDANFDCTLNPTDTSAITSAQVGLFSWQLTINHADGSADAIALDTLSIVGNGDDGESYVAYGSGTVYDADGNLTESVDVTVNLNVVEDGQGLAVSGGTLNITEPLTFSVIAL